MPENKFGVRWIVNPGEPLNLRLDRIVERLAIGFVAFLERIH